MKSKGTPIASTSAPPARSFPGSSGPDEFRNRTALPAFANDRLPALPRCPAGSRPPAGGSAASPPAASGRNDAVIPLHSGPTSWTSWRNFVRHRSPSRPPRPTNNITGPDPVLPALPGPRLKYSSAFFPPDAGFARRGRVELISTSPVIAPIWWTDGDPGTRLRLGIVDPMDGGTVSELPHHRGLNSRTQQEYILGEASAPRAPGNVEIVTCDMNRFEPEPQAVGGRWFRRGPWRHASGDGDLARSTDHGPRTTDDRLCRFVSTAWCQSRCLSTCGITSGCSRPLPGG